MSTCGFSGTFIYFAKNKTKFNPKVMNMWLIDPTVHLWLPQFSNHNTGYQDKTITAEFPVHSEMKAVLLTSTRRSALFLQANFKQQW